jgi:hypothetical protein
MEVKLKIAIYWFTKPCSFVGVMSRLRAGRPRDRGSNLDRNKIFSHLQTFMPALDPTQPPDQSYLGILSNEQSD